MVLGTPDQRLVRQLTAVVGIACLTTGCAFSMATVRSTYRGDVGVFKAGAERKAVVAELGAPDVEASLSDGGSIEIYLIDPKAHRAGSRTFAAVSHLILTTGTLGLWELVGGPLELALADRFLTYVVRYDKDGKLVETEIAKEWAPTTVSESERQNCDELASLETLGVTRPAEPGNLVEFTQKGFEANKARQMVYHETRLRCLLRLHAERIQ